VIGIPSRTTESGVRLARIQTDGGTNEEVSHLEMNSSPNATPAGGLEEFPEIVHDHVPHIYVMYWPEHGILKVGISAKARWEQWRRLGAVPIATADTCCMEHARTIEAWMLKRLSRFGARAFFSEEEARFALGKKRGGYSECYRLVQSPRRGELPDSPYDYERAYGLILPPPILADIEAYNFAPAAIDDFEWETG
jgi:hypothetical protein